MCQFANMPMCQYANVPIGCAIMPHGNWPIGILAHWQIIHYSLNKKVFRLQ